ncbi:MAG TPA: hypothetical protein V6C57_23650 [Coleofasciculaceae cyanobacterium]
MIILSHTERQQIEEIRVRSLRWQATGETPGPPEQQQHDIYFLLLILDQALKEGEQ